MKRITLLMIILLFLSSSFLCADSMDDHEKCINECNELEVTYVSAYDNCCNNCNMNDVDCYLRCKRNYLIEDIQPCYDRCSDKHLKEDDQGCFIECSCD